MSTLRLATAALLAAGLAVPASAVAAPPAPCGGTAQITDATGDGHHQNTDVTSAWFGQTAGQLQAVVKVKSAAWEPAHEDAISASWSVLFRVGSTVRYVRGVAARGVPVAYDHGTWTSGGGFVSAGATTGEVVAGPGGTITIAVPAATGAVPGAVISEPFVLTSDGEDAPGVTHWVDRAPGGTSPTEPAYGADLVVGTCTGTGGGGTGGGTGGGDGTGTGGGGTGTGTGGSTGGGTGGGGTGGGGTGTGGGVTGGGTTDDGTTGGGGSAGLTSVQFTAPARATGAARVRISGRVVPARAGLIVSIRSTVSRVKVPNLVTRADGTFSGLVSVPESTGLRAVVGGFGSQTRSIVVRPLVRITVKKLRSGAVLVTGIVKPGLPGRVQLLRTTAITPSATATVTRGRFRIRLSRPAKGRYQALFSPSGDRAERATSNTGVIR